MINFYLTEIKQKLAKVEALDSRKIALNGLALFFILISIAILFICFTEYIFRFNTLVRAIIFYLFILFFSVLFFLLFIKPVLKSFFIFSKPNFISASSKVGSAFSNIKDELLNALEIISNKTEGYSADLINASVARIYKKTANLDFTKSVDFSQSFKKIKIGLAIAIISTLLIILIPAFNSSAIRLINYDKSFVPPQKFYFNVLPGDKEITKGDSLTITVTTIGEAPSEIFLFTKTIEQAVFNQILLTAVNTGKYFYRILDVRNSFEYYAIAEGIKSDVYKISVINRPSITQLDVTIIPPAYSRLPIITQRDNGNISALSGSKIVLNIKCSRELSTAKINFSDSTKHNLIINNKNASTEFTIKNSIKYFIDIKDNQGIDGINPITYTIQKLEDRSPLIELISPQENVKLGVDGKLPISVKISDDFGFSSLLLNYRLSTSKYRSTNNEYSKIPISIKKDIVEDEIFYLWDLSPLYLAEGEALSFFLEVFDNDNVNGPKSTKSQILSVFVPSLDEMFKSSENSQIEATEELKETLKEAEKLGVELKKISDELKQNSKEINWQEKERIEKVSKKFSDLLQKAEDANQKLDELRKELMQNNLLSEETLQKYNELQNLLEQLDSEELLNALKRMQEAMQNMLRDNIQMSLEELKANEEYFKKSIERTLNLLKRVQVEMKVDELIKRVENISSKLDDLSNKTEQTNLNDKPKRDELIKRQDDLSKDLSNLLNEMKNLEDIMSELTDMPLNELEKLIDEFEKQKNEELSQEIMEELKKLQKSEATKSQKQLSKNIQNTKSSINNLQAVLQQLNQMKTFYEMMKILDDLLTLSKMQEDLKNKTSVTSPQSPELNKNTRMQNELQNNLNRVLQKMSSLSQKTFAITPEMGRALGKANSEMQQSIIMMQNGNPTFAAQKQIEAMKNLNNAASLIKGGIDKMMNGGQGGSMMGLMQQLQKLAQQQMELNQLTQMLNQGKMTQEMMAQIQRIAQQQEIIRKSLEQLNRETQEAGKSKLLASNLEKILNEMKEVVSNLQSQKIDDDLVKQQERILSKLLDAQRSINERDFEKERRANVGKEIIRSSPPELIFKTEEGKNKIKDELLKAIREGYKKDYEDLIRKYFESLEKYYRQN